jgi:hypothetical protein
MTSNGLTHHAETRSQQRSIPPFVVNLLRDYGASVHHQGAEVLFADKLARKRIRHDVGKRIYPTIEPYLDAYVVDSNDRNTITVGWRTGRLKRP